MTASACVVIISYTLFFEGVCICASIVSLMRTNQQMLYCDPCITLNASFGPTRGIKSINKNYESNAIRLESRHLDDDATVNTVLQARM